MFLNLGKVKDDMCELAILMAQAGHACYKRSFLFYAKNKGTVAAGTGSDSSREKLRLQGGITGVAEKTTTLVAAGTSTVIFVVQKFRIYRCCFQDLSRRRSTLLFNGCAAGRPVPSSGLSKVPLCPRDFALT